MEERELARLPWATAPLGPRTALAVVFAGVAGLMGWSLAGQRGVFVGALLGLFWGVLEVLVFIFPDAVQQWTRRRPLFTPLLSFPVVLFGLLFLSDLPTLLAVLAAAFVSGIWIVVATFRARRPPVSSRPQPPKPGRRHS
jgi:hypothetical protein